MEDEKKDVDFGIGEENKSETPSTLNNPSEAEEKKEEKGAGKKTKPLNKKFIALLILLVILGVSYSAYKSNNEGFNKMLSAIGVKKAAAPVGMTTKEAEDFINQNLMQSGTGATVQEVTEEEGLYKIKLTVSGQEYTAYLTKDKIIFFPQAINIAELQKQKVESETQEKAEQEKQLSEMTKNDKPQVELFVMSHCPYGTQMEKGIIPVVKALGDKIDFKVKFCDYSMHGDKELKEELNQYCISQDQPDKMVSYLECFLADENSSDKCMAQVGIDKNKISSCVASTDAQYKITANAANKATWKSGSYPAFPIYQADVDKYQISGSPSLVVNGKLITSGRDSESLLKTVCAGFNNAPEECSKALSSTAPSAGFGYSGSEGSASSGTCGS